MAIPSVLPLPRRPRPALQNSQFSKIDLGLFPPDPHLVRAMGPATCLRHAAVPVMRIGNTTVFASEKAEVTARFRNAIPAEFGEAVIAKALRSEIERAVIAACGGLLSAQAETRVAEHESCRFWYDGSPRRVLLIAVASLLVASFLAPVAVFALAFGWTLLTLLGVTAMKLAAFWPRPKSKQAAIANKQDQVPGISMMVPLFREEDILPRLISRLSKLDYPRDRLEICLVTEGDDVVTRQMLSQTVLPSWMRTITVPPGQLRTKPKALNFALDMCRGDIIGIWDAEDAPEPDQLLKVAQHFATAPPELACLQGALDYYNSKQNWLTRCFTIEYGAWWRVVLPGVARLGFILPLGGTSLFLRRDVIEKLDRWDAHNVTEDADLGVRLARHGYRTEIIPTATHEEATSQIWPWVRQRSRWLKGFMMTWCTHMRFPGLLLRQIGLWRFIGLQVLFLCSLSQVLLAPLLWSLWLVPLGVGHPLEPYISATTLIVILGLFLATEFITMATGCLGAIRSGKPSLVLWVPTLHLYYPLATLAAYKALWEMVFKPFYWDKTQHGHSGDQTSLA
ncbi:glycosyltransferase family 2 protein [Actibacterium pelagium]|uniref:Glycosyl transferase n=1 Tax=Actibacterium pelagium TaxID=2029103 RepID=A0A917EMP8_9RHOB|nr:glycosyltransferase family 2 protein [Actibacterium pelagium]GGE57324.1 glycosyl transferase [Actibacterium pelagium]